MVVRDLLGYVNKIHGAIEGVTGINHVGVLNDL